MQNFKERGNAHNNRKRYVFYPETSGRMVKLDIHFEDGGMSMFTYKNSKRGIYISLTVVEIDEPTDGLPQMERYSPFADINSKFLIAEATRYNAKKLAKVAEAFEDSALEISKTWLDEQQMAADMIRNAQIDAVNAIS